MGKTVQRPLARQPGEPADRFTEDGGDPQRHRRPRSGTGRAAAWCVGALVGCGVGLRWWSSSPLWLDEAQSVAIARLPPEQLFAALREDGSPPLYYLLLHVWMLVFGQGDTAVRALSALVSVATLPLMWDLARRLSGSTVVAWAALVILAASPFAIRYATEARMYAPVMLLTVLGGYALLALRRRGVVPVLALAAVAGALALTHYWTFFLLGLVGGALAWLAVRRRGDEAGRAATRGLLGLATGGAALLPWLPTLGYQLAHTGAPWGSPAWFTSVGGVVGNWSGGGLPGQLLATTYWGLAILAIAGRVERGRLVFGRPARRSALILAGLAFGPIIAGVAVSHVLGSAYAARYSSVGLAAFVLLLAYAIGVLPPKVRYPAVGAVAVLGLLAGATAVTEDRTQAAEIAAVIQEQGKPGDVVVVCPDQLGPGLRRLLPSDRFRHVAYPTFQDTVRVDWTDYAQRNEAADPAEFAERVHRLAGDHAVWYAHADGYRTFGYQCSRLRAALRDRHGDSVTFVWEKVSVVEGATLTRFGRST